ncbi:MAG: hypothetical protein PHU69_13480 [Fermentimonas sp.]|nr:hypothetical protein [Fermentimonas sp.]
MAWNEYILKCFAWARMERNKWEHTRLIAFESKVGSHLDYKTLPKSLNDYLPLDGKQTKTKSIEHQQAMEALRRERAEAKARIEQLKKEQQLNS